MSERTLEDRADAILRTMDARAAASRLGRSMARETDLDMLAMREAARVIRELLEVRAGVVTEEPKASWQWCYVEKWIDGSGVYERVTFDNEAKARRYLRNNAERVEGLNQEFNADDQIVASVEKRRTHTPGEWLPVEQEGETR